MIYAELAGGLGNQMFIYAAARALGLRLKQPVTLLDRQDWRGGTAPAHTRCALQDLCIDPAVAITAEPQFAKKHLPVQNAVKALLIKREQRGGMLNRDWSGFECRMAPMVNRLGVHFVTDGYLPLSAGPLPKDLLLWGYFQSADYFADHAGTVRAELVPRPELYQSEPLADCIAAAACPVALHLRGGDYRRPENAHLQVCGPFYYARAAAAVAKQYPDATLFVFSDEMDWAKTVLDPAGLPVVWCEGTRPAAADLGLMALCRHFILSNSTYSWWAQYFGTAPDKTVLAPDRWNAGGKKTALYQPQWQLIRTQ